MPQYGKSNGKTMHNDIETGMIQWFIGGDMRFHCTFPRYNLLANTVNLNFRL